jgi:hypothetical protein
MGLRVEFYGIARQRAGVQHIDLPLTSEQTTLGEVLLRVAQVAPQFSAECLVEGRLHPSLAANLDGETFVADPTAIIRCGQSLLILSADAGG